MKDYWPGLFGRASLEESRSPDAVRPTLDVDGPINEDEIKRALKTTKPSTAPGPDGRRREDVSALNVDQLDWAMNILLLLKDVPQTWAMGRTTLIPKTPEAKDPGDFRPITITSILLSKARTNIMGDTCPIRRGVLQGDRLSPYLFNITLDWALSQVPADVGARLAGTPLSYCLCG
ncbi:Retrovirus-related Pol polyprotein from type-1 retrotransposable element R2 [Portunus trituberculatus]|uniref:Retrovirus-related Pol polyprotein from type-1 retrotransposable element R2 n=1 Tax=Portunus trituberculatus TaxID=210409 RepID=A0A5B7IIX5_PORTR|nr:Retrovirus-related Pol polyprotein from type-1 retrotransposable element R2 [Portunus trituberculatus]